MRGTPVANRIGQKYGMLTITGVAYPHGRTYVMACHCDCGVSCEAHLQGLVEGRTMHCGCRHYTARFPVEATAWRSMIARCTNPNIPNYKRYGARGITVCQRWIESFEAFYADMGPRPSDKHSLDRIDVNGNYEPANVRWATRKEQDQNTTRSRRLTVYGVTHVIAEWARICGISNQRMGTRFDSRSPEEAVLKYEAARKYIEAILDRRRKECQGK